MQNRCTRILQAQRERKRGKQRSSQDGRGGGWWVVGGVCVYGGGQKKNHYTARGWKGCHKEFHYFSSSIEKVDCAYCNFFPSHHKPLNNLGSFQGRSFPFPLRSLPRVQGRGAQSPQLKETLTHKNTPCHHHLLLLFHPPVLLSVLRLRSILNHSISHTSSSTSPCNHCPYSLLHSVCISPLLSSSISFLTVFSPLLSLSGATHMLLLIVLSIFFPPAIIFPPLFNVTVTCWH